MNYIFREYKHSDYEQCEELVNQAWSFDKIFRPKALSDIAKCIYTKGSVLNSNFKMIAEVDGQVAGFIFGLNEFAKKPRRPILFGLNMMWKLMRIKNKNSNKEKLLVALQAHEKNRSTLVSRGRSEIVLFVIANEYKGKGFGTELWTKFKNYCVSCGVKSIIVETNTLGASGFYERIGFSHLGDFDSPLHELATKGGQACIYEYSVDQPIDQAAV